VSADVAVLIIFAHHPLALSRVLLPFEVRKRKKSIGWRQAHWHADARGRGSWRDSGPQSSVSRHPGPNAIGGEHCQNSDWAGLRQ
jgi:hypothetical protein